MACASTPVKMIFLTFLDRVGAIATLCLPFFLVHFRAGGEISLDILALSFVIRSIVSRDGAWLHTWITKTAFFWWTWIVVCSLVRISPTHPQTMMSALQAVLAIRFPVAAFALAFWTLRHPATFKFARLIVVIAFLYIGIQFFIQASTGTNLFGQPKLANGVLTGPYDKARAAIPFSRLSLPIGLWLSTKLRPTALGGYAQLLFRIAFFGLSLFTLILAGQRMPLAEFLLGLLVAALLMRETRSAMGAALLFFPVALGLAYAMARNTFEHLIAFTWFQLRDFGSSPYGLIYNRAANMLEQHLFLGLGYDAFRYNCAKPSYFLAQPFTHALNGGGAEICVQHAHNLWLEAATNGGVLGLLLFAIMVITWGTAILRPITRRSYDTNVEARAWQIGLFCTLFAHVWPLASSSSFLNLPAGGWAFMLLGFALLTPSTDAKKRVKASLPSSKPL